MAAIRAIDEMRMGRRGVTTVSTYIASLAYSPHLLFTFSVVPTSQLSHLQAASCKHAPERAVDSSVGDVHLHTIISKPDHGTSAHPPPLFLHFWGGSNATYLPLVSVLSSSFNSIAPSLRGWGASSKPVDPEAHRISDYSADGVTLINRLHESDPDLFANSILLIGHSMGGKLAQYLLTQQHLMQPPIKALALLAPAPAGSFSLPPDMRDQQMHAYDSAASAEYVKRNVLLAHPDAVDAEIVQKVAADAVSGSAGARAAWPAYGMSEDYEKGVRAAVGEYAKQQGPLKMLVLVGESDRVETPASVKERTVEMLRDSGASVEFLTLPNVGHINPTSPKEPPVKVAGLIQRLVS